MRVFIKAVITGFGLAVGKAIYDQVSDRLGMGNKRKGEESEPVIPNGDDVPVRNPS
jgi:hypothetical protein